MTVALVIQGYSSQVSNFQPWRYCVDVAQSWCRRGEELHIITSPTTSRETTSRVLVFPILESGVRTAAHERPAICRYLADYSPRILVYVVNETLLARYPPSFFHGLHEDLRALLPGPIIQLRELSNVGWNTILLEWRYVGNHLISAAARSFATRLHRATFGTIICASLVDARRLERWGVTGDIRVVSPCLSLALSPETAHWESPDADELSLIYAGPPLITRGASDVIAATDLLHGQGIEAKLTILARAGGNLYEAELRRLMRMTRSTREPGLFRVVSNALPRERFIEMLTRSHLVVLPFRVVPSVIPLIIQETLSWGVPTVTTALSHLIEFTQSSCLYCPPRNPKELATIIADNCSEAKLAILARRQQKAWNEILARSLTT